MEKSDFQKPTKLQNAVGQFATKVYRFAYVWYALIGNFVVRKFSIKQKVEAELNVKK